MNSFKLEFNSNTDLIYKALNISDSRVAELLELTDMSFKQLIDTKDKDNTLLIEEVEYLNCYIKLAKNNQEHAWQAFMSGFTYQHFVINRTDYYAKLMEFILSSSIKEEVNSNVSLLDVTKHTIYEALGVDKDILTTVNKKILKNTSKKLTPVKYMELAVLDKYNSINELIITMYYFGKQLKKNLK